MLFAELLKFLKNSKLARGCLAAASQNSLSANVGEDGLQGAGRETGQGIRSSRGGEGGGSLPMEAQSDLTHHFSTTTAVKKGFYLFIIYFPPSFRNGSLL